MTVAAHEPREPRGEIAICVPLEGRWHPMDIVTRGLGGTETAASRLAEELAELDYQVTLYSDCEDGVLAPKSRNRPHILIRDWRTFDPTVKRVAVIIERRPELYGSPLNAERKLFWIHDTDWGDKLTAQRARQVDRVLCVSTWHEQHLRNLYPFAAHKLYRIRNGITPSFFTRRPAPERQQRVLYTSMPARGLDILLEIWPAIREAVPQAELIHTCAPAYEREAQMWLELIEHQERVRELADQPGVRSLSGLPQPALAELMRSSLVWAHPSYSSPAGGKFYETSCIGAMEAQAAGCCVVAGNWGALPETVQVGTLISGDPNRQEWRNRFAEAIIAGLTDERVQRTAQSQGPEIALRWDWAGVAETVAALLTSSAGRWRRLPTWGSGRMT